MAKLTSFIPALTVASLASLPVFADNHDDNCNAIGGAVAPACDPVNGQIAVRMPAEPNTDFDQHDIGVSGLAISIDGVPVSGGGLIVDQLRRADLALEAADISVAFDGLNATPRLDVERVGGDRPARAGDVVTLQSALNYPAFVARAEMRVVDLAAPGGPRTLAIAPVTANGQVQIRLPEGRALAVVHRVYDGAGRYDETVPLPLMQKDARANLDGIEEGSDLTARRAIPIAGGSVTVSGRARDGRAIVRTMGEAIRPASDGRFVLQRIMPVGIHQIDVAVDGAGRPVTLSRDIEIPASEMFYFATADATIGFNRAQGATQNYQTGRLAFYVNGRMANGVEFTASGDTGEGDLSGLFTGLDARNPDQLFLRLDPESAYPVYGDDSTFEETAPTSGRLYLKLAKDGNHLLWGNFSQAIQGTDYLRSERTLYGLQGKWASQAQTVLGKPKAQVDVYAASPDNLPQRDVFGATGGTVYFLQRQDISVGSEVLSIELRDPVTGRVLTSQPLVYGKDYDINYFQGVVTLTTPLASSAGLTGATPPSVNLVAQYEYAPSGFAVTGQNYGGRAEAQLAPNLRFGITAQVEKTGTANQTAMGVDATYDLGDASYVRVELAQSDGPGFGSSFSSNAGLTVTNGAVTAGSGRAGKIETRLTFSDFGGQTDGYVSAYAEAREAGFSSLDYQVQNDETLWGVATVLMPTEALQVSLAYDAYDNSAGDRRHEGRLEAHFEPVGNWAYQLGLTHSDQLGATGNGTRTDIDARITHHFADDSNLYVFGQYTLQETGLGRDDRFGIGGETPIGETGWAFEGQVSDGSSGLGAKALVSQKSQTGDSTYFGYELDPNRTLAGSPGGARDQGKFIFGGRRQVTPSLSTWGENSYDLFGQRKSLTSAYGVDYAPQEALRYSASFELGDVIDPVSGNYRRTGVSAGVTYQQDERWSARARLGYRLDEDAGGEATTWALTARARYEPNETERLSFNLEAVDTTSSLTAVTAGRLVDASLGYARRPVADDQLNLLFKYRYLYDMFGQTIDGSATTGPRQISHVLSVDGEYDLSRSWTIGGKLGYRLSSVSPSLGSPFARNDAWLAVASARYHIVHKWDGLLEARALGAVQAQTTDFGLLGAVYRHVNNNAKIGLGYNFGRFSDDLTDLTHDDQGLFVNFVAKF